MESTLNNGLALNQIPTVQHHESLSNPLITAPANDSHLEAEETLPVLVVEDYPANLLVVTAFLEQLGYSFDVACSGEGAVKKVKETKYAGILMDVQMRGISGFEATRQIREYELNQGLAPMPIIGMTAYSLSGDRNLCRDAGMDDYIPKPFDPDVLKAKLAAHIRKSNRKETV